MGTTDRYHTRWCLAEGSNRLPQLFLEITEQLSPRCRINLKKQRLEKATGVRGTRKEYWRSYRHLVHQKSKLVHWNEKSCWMKNSKTQIRWKNEKFELGTSTESGWTIKLQLESSTSTLPPTSSSLFESVSPTAFLLGNAVIWVRRFYRLSIQKQGYIWNVEWISAFSEFG